MSAKIEGVRLIELVRHEDDRGYLYEIIRSTDEFLPKFGQVYVVCSPVRGSVRAFHKHAVLWDYFCIVKGAAKFVLAKASERGVRSALRRGEESRAQALETYVLTERKPSLLVVPPGTWHGVTAPVRGAVVSLSAEDGLGRQDRVVQRTCGRLL